jgi:hypothetical protein
MTPPEINKKSPFEFSKIDFGKAKPTSSQLDELLSPEEQKKLGITPENKKECEKIFVHFTLFDKNPQSIKKNFIQSMEAFKNLGLSVQDLTAYFKNVRSGVGYVSILSFLKVLPDLLKEGASPQKVKEFLLEFSQRTKSGLLTELDKGKLITLFKSEASAVEICDILLNTRYQRMDSKPVALKTLQDENKENIKNLDNVKYFLSAKTTSEIDKTVWPEGYQLIKDGDKRYLQSPEGKRYQICEAKWYKDQFPGQDGIPRPSIELYFESQDKPALIFSMKLRHYDEEPNKSGILQNRIQAAHADYENEIKSADLAKKYDLPKDKPIGFISFNSATKQDVITSTDAKRDEKFNQYLTAAGYQVKEAAVKNVNNINDVRQALRQQYQQGIRHFYLTFNFHGSEKGFSGVYFTPQQLLELCNEFPDCKFCLNTNACSGANLREVTLNFFKKFPEAQQRVSVFLQAKPHQYSVEGRMVAPGKMIPDPYSSYYNFYYEQYLLEGKSLGEAHYLADMAVQKVTRGQNPEAIINGVLISADRPAKNSDQKSHVV